MNKLHAVFLTAVLAAGTTVATDQEAKQVAMERLNGSVFLAQKDEFLYEIKNKFLEKNNTKKQIFEILAPPQETQIQITESQDDGQGENNSALTTVIPADNGPVENPMDASWKKDNDVNKQDAQQLEIEKSEISKKITGIVKRSSVWANNMWNDLNEFANKALHSIDEFFGLFKIYIKKLTGQDQSKFQKIPVDPESMTYSTMPETVSQTTQVGSVEMVYDSENANKNQNEVDFYNEKYDHSNKNLQTKNSVINVLNMEGR